MQVSIKVIFLSTAAVLWGAISVSGLKGPGVEDTEDFPRLLSQTGLYSEDGSTVDERNLPYSPQYPLWTDGAMKSRWIFLPPGTKIDTRDVDAWKFPVGTRLWKQFAFSGHKVETRLLWKRAEGWSYASYLWNDDQTDAVLAPSNGVPDYYEFAPNKRHSIPGVSDCRNCHEHASASVLGFTALQLSTDRDPNALHGEPLRSGMVTLQTLVERGLLSPSGEELVKEPPRIPTSNPRTRALLGYFVGNCAHCHVGEDSIGLLGLSFVHRYTARTEAEEPGIATTVGQESRWQVPYLGKRETFRIEPGSPERSSVFFRMSSRHPSSQMPPLGTVLADTDAVELLRQWIQEDLPRRDQHGKAGSGPG